jgi:bacillithiol system protein YtxJ
LDVINFRSLSDQISDIFEVYHESPQVLLIKNGNCIYDESHYAINLDEIVQVIA